MFTTTYPNITPDAETGAGAWSDDMLARAIGEGIGHDGRPLLPIMPYNAFRNLSDEDLAAIVVYLRSIPPIQHRLPKMQIHFPFNLALKGIPRPLRRAVPSPNTSDPLVAAENLMQVGGCAGCHDGVDREGHRLPYAGGQVISNHGVKSAAAANLTPDPSGIPYYDEAMFIRVMRTGHVGARELAAAMPWRYFRNFTDEDLKRIFAYLRTLRSYKTQDR
jgi:mono/diheme cytochrome c family protein